jgi:hypothetical protein
LGENFGRGGNTQRVADLTVVQTTPEQRSIIASYIQLQKEEQKHLDLVEQDRDLMALQVTRLRDSGLRKQKIQAVLQIKSGWRLEDLLERGRNVEAQQQLLKEKWDGKPAQRSSSD